MDPPRQMRAIASLGELTGAIAVDSSSELCGEISFTTKNTKEHEAEPPGGSTMGRSTRRCFPNSSARSCSGASNPSKSPALISFLLSDDALIIRGQAISADGGDTPN